MTSKNTNNSKPLLLAGLCGLMLWGGAAAAHGGDDRYDRADRYERKHLAHQLDRRGDRIERRLDRKGDRIAARLHHQADHLRDQGRYAEAYRLDRKAIRIDRRLDRKGERINRRLDRKADKLRYGYRGHTDGYRHRDYRDYRPRHPRHAHESGVTVAVDLGRWVFRP